MDVFLIIIMCVVGILLMIVNIYLLALYCHPEDGGFGASLFCKIVVVLGLTLSWCQILMLALDVSNERSQGGLDMQLCWMIIYISIFVMIVFFIPLAIFYYESDEDKSFCSRLCVTLFQESMVLIFVFLIIFLSYYWLQDAEIPIHLVTLTSDSIVDSASELITPIVQEESEQLLKLPVSVITFTVGLLCFVGYFFLILYGGVGLTALPFDLMFSYGIRPVYRTSAQALQKKNQIKKMITEMIGYALQLKEEEKDLKFSHSGWFAKRSKSSRIETGYKKLLQGVQMLEEEYEIFQMELDIGKSNPLVYIIKLLLGIILMMVTITWWIHLLLFTIITPNGVPLNTFLNKMFIDLEMYNVNFLAVFFFGFFTLYLLWCVIKGNMVFNMPWIFSFHPMKINETWMNSFLFNIMLILLSSIALTHFSTSVFSQYTRLTTIDLMFGIQIKYLTIFKWAFNNHVFEYTLFGWSILSALVYGVLSCRKPSVLQQIEERRKKQQGNNKQDIELKEFFIKK